MGSWGLQKVYGAFKTAMYATDWKLDKTLKAFYMLFSDTPARRENYITMSGTATFSSRVLQT